MSCQVVDRELVSVAIKILPPLANCSIASIFVKLFPIFVGFYYKNISIYVMYVCVCVCMCMFHVILTTNTSHFPKRTEHLISLVSIGVFCLVGTEYLAIIYICSGLSRFRRVSKSRSLDSEANLPFV